jgi:AsmA protein
MARKILIAFGVLIALLVVAVVVLVASFDANRFKPQIQDHVASRYQRTLAIDGDLSLSVFPRIAISIPATRLSERGSADPVASVGAARVSVELLPLLRGAVVADKIRIDKLTATVVRRADGSLSIDDLLGRDGQPAETGPKDGGGAIGPTAIDIGGIEIIGAELRYVDEAAARTVGIHELDLVTGAIASRGTTPVKLAFVVRSDQPQAEAKVSAAGNLQLDLPAGAVSGTGLTMTIGAQAELDGQRKLNATVQAKGVEASTSSLVAETVELAARLIEPTRTVDAKLAGPLTGDLAAMVFELPRLAGSIDIEDPALPQGKVAMPIEARLKADAGNERIELDTLTTIEGSIVDAKTRVSNFAKPRIDFDLQADKLDLDRIAPPVAPPPAAKPVPAGGTATAAGGTPIDLSPLAGLELDGRIAIGELAARGIQASDVRATIKAHGGRLDVAPLAAKLYGGTLDAKLSAQASGNRVGADAALANVAVGPLLEAATGNRLIEGTGAVKMQVASAGATVEAMKRAVGGKASLVLTDGAVRGIDLGEKIRQARDLLGRGESEQAASDATKKTDFSSMSISFDIRDGIASSKDLDLKSPLLRVTGDGRIDIGADTIDYTARPALVATSTGQGGRERDDLHGITIPVRVTGPLAAPGWQIDWASAAREMLESRAADKLKESLAPKVDELRQQRDDAKEDLKGKATEKLRGLFNR